MRTLEDDIGETSKYETRVKVVGQKGPYCELFGGRFGYKNTIVMTQKAQ